MRLKQEYWHCTLGVSEGATTAPYLKYMAVGLLKVSNSNTTNSKKARGAKHTTSSPFEIIATGWSMDPETCLRRHHV